MQFVWFTWSLIMLLVWTVIYFLVISARKEMLKTSLWTMPLGLSEPLFVPEYWKPPSLFNLAEKTGFDIESILFSFAIGGIGSVLYRIIFPASQMPVNEFEKSKLRHKIHRYTLAIPVVIFVLLAFFTNLNHIYCGVIALLSGATSALFCRPDLKRKIFFGGILFTGLYFIYFSSLRWFYPDYVEKIWKLVNLSGTLFNGIPLEEFLFAFTFGMFWSSLYEHINWLMLASEKHGKIGETQIAGRHIKN